MANKKKKKKKPAGARKATYAKGKMVEATEQKKPSGARQPVAASKTGTQAKGKPATKGEQKPEVQPWNLIRKGTLEAKVMWALLVIIAILSLARYPLTKSEADAQYKAATVQYQKDLKSFEKKYPTQQEQKKHEKEKPAQPKKPTTNLILVNVLFGLLQSAIFAFLGLNILRRTDLGTPVLDKSLGGEGIRAPDLAPFGTWSIPAGILMLAPLYLDARISTTLVNNVFQAAEAVKVKYPLYKEVLGSFNDGLFFFVLFVFVAVPALVWLFTRYRDRTRLEPHWGALAGAFILAFGFVLLNVSSAVRSSGQHVSMATDLAYALGLSLPVPILGYVFWKKGLEYSLLAAMIGFGLYPIMASFIMK